MLTENLPHTDPVRDAPAPGLSLAQLLEGSPDGCGAIDRAGRCLYVNREAERVLGRARAGLLGQRVWDAFPAAARDIVYREAQRALDENITTCVRVPWPPLHGWFEVRACPNEVGLSLYFRDVTAEAKVEAARSAIEEERNRLLQERAAPERGNASTREPCESLALSEARDAAEAENRAKDHFLSVLSHELRTPLTPVLMAVSVMQRAPSLPPQAKKYLEMIRRNIDLEAKLIDDLLDLTRITRNVLQLELRPTSVHGLIQRVTESLGADIAAKKVVVRLDLAATDDRILADPARLHQVLWNLIKNAIKFTPNGGNIVIRSEDQRPSGLRIEVQDDGIGIDAEALPRIFNAFEQGEQTMTRRFGGLGLGLSIARALVELHGGSIEAHSEGLGRGARISVVLNKPCSLGASPQTPASASRPL